MPRTAFPALFCRGVATLPELRKLEQLAVQALFRPDQTIFSFRDPADTAFGLTSGLVRLYKWLPDGRRQVLAFALPGEFLGMPLDERYKFSADAIGEVVLCRFPRDSLTKIFQTSPSLMRLMIEFAIHELDRAQDQLLLLANGSAEERVAIFLVSWRSRLAAISACSQSVPLMMRRQDIADFLGLQLETVSRTFAKLEQKGLIHLVPKGVVLTGLEDSPLVAARSGWPEVHDHV